MACSNLTKFLFSKGCFETTCGAFSQQRIYRCTTMCVSSNTFNGNCSAESDIISYLEKDDSVIVLVLLDLSAAFDMIDHSFILSRLRDMYGIHDQTLV